MEGGIRATVAFPDRVPCPAAEISSATGASPESVVHSVCPEECGGVVTEFAVDESEAPEPDLVREAVTTGDPVKVFTHGATHWYRVHRDADAACPCARLGRLGIPVARHSVRDGRVLVEFHAVDHDELRGAVAGLREEFPGLEIRRLARSPGGEAVDTVPVDRGRLTDRQREVLETAHRMGYFERPRGANATEIAAALDIDPSTYSEHLAAAQRKLLADLFP